MWVFLRDGYEGGTSHIYAHPGLRWGIINDAPHLRSLITRILQGPKVEVRTWGDMNMIITRIAAVSEELRVPVYPQVLAAMERNIEYKEESADVTAMVPKGWHLSPVRLGTLTP